MDTRTVVRTYLDRIVDLDWPGALEYVTDDVVLHVPGDHSLAGKYLGKDAFMGYIQKVVALTDSMRMEEHDFLASDDHAVALMRAHLTVGDEEILDDRIAIYHVADDKITELWLVDVDQAAMAELIERRTQATTG